MKKIQIPAPKGFYFYFKLIVFILIILQSTCQEEIPPLPEAKIQEKLLIREFISRKWVGTNVIPGSKEVGVDFADTGLARVSCFSFSNAQNTNITHYEWKSDIYSNNNPPREAWFNATTNQDGDHQFDIFFLDDLRTETSYFFILRYNSTNNHLAWFLTNKKDGKNYSAIFPIGSVKDRVGGNSENPDYTGYPLYMPILIRNFNPNTQPASIEFNFIVNFAAGRTNEEPNWTDIYNDLKSRHGYSQVRNQWTTYYETDNIEGGNHGCNNIR